MSQLQPTRYRPSSVLAERGAGTTARPGARRWLVSGGAGFIGSALVRHLIGDTDDRVLVIDALTYAGRLANLADVAESSRYALVETDICDRGAVAGIVAENRPDVVVHLAAETHVDRSIDDASPFLHTNVGGTMSMLAAIQDYWAGLDGPDRDGFRFLHMSTDEVFGSLGSEGRFNQDCPYRPNSPYAASKAASDHFVRAWRHTYGLPTLTMHCSNNYGPRQFPEKLIPMMILNGIEGRAMGVYGSGTNIRDWIFVEDTVRAIVAIAEAGRVGESYTVGACAEHTNIEVVRMICAILDELRPDSPHAPHENLIRFVQDRPGHDLRYAVDAERVERELGWRPSFDLRRGLWETVDWYLANEGWWRPIRERAYGGSRLGLTQMASELAPRAG